MYWSTAMPNTRVLPFPPRPEPVRVAAPLIAWWRCAGGCGQLVSSQGAICIACALAEDDR